MTEPRRIVAPTDLRSAKNASGSTLTRYRCMTGDAANAPDAVDFPAAITDPFAGIVTDADIADGDWGTIQHTGRALVHANGALAAEIAVEAVASTGRVQAHTTGTIVGITKSAATAQDDVIEIELRGPGSAVS